MNTTTNYYITNKYKLTFMIRKSILATLMVALMCVFATPAQAQFKKLGKSLGKAAQDAGKSLGDAATDAALEKGANVASDKIVDFMDNNNTVAADDSEYVVRLKEIMGDKFKSAEGKDLDIKVYENEEANVISLSNGDIRIYSGMLDILEDEEVKGLIALQAGHITSKNVRDNLMKAVSGESAEDAGAAQVEKLLSFSGDQFGSIVNELLQLPYSVEQNKKADKFAKDYLKTQGVDVAGFNSLLTKVQTLGYVDLDAEDLDEEDAKVMQATAASKFVLVNKVR